MNRIPVVLCAALLALWSSLAVAATSLNGVWSNSAGGYLVMLEASSGGTVVVLQVEPDLVTGKLYVGSRSGDSVSATSIDKAVSLALSVTDSAYSGSRTQGNTPQAVSGQLLFAYVGGAYDGAWQRSGSSDRYFAILTATINQASAVVVVDIKLDSAGTPAYDVVLGTLANTSFAGKSLVSGNAVTMSFVAGSPATASYSALTASLPPTQVENFGLTQLFAIAAPAATFTLTSSAYTDGGAMPLKQACTEQSGSNASPALAWRNAPSGTAAYALVMDDEVSPCGSGNDACIHWNAFNLPASTSVLAEGVDPATLGSSVVLGSAYNDATGYQGPCPPSPHVYKLTLYALDSTLSLSGTPTLTRSQFASTYSARILGSATLTGTFGQ